MNLRIQPRWRRGIAATLCLGLFVLCPAGASAQDGDVITEPDPEGFGDGQPEMGIPPDEVLRLYRRYEWSALEGGLTQGSLTAAAVSAQDPRLLYLGGGGQVYRSRDGGERWDNTLSVQGLDDTTDTDGDDADGNPRRSGAERDSRRQELIDERIERKYLEMRRDLLDDLESEVDDREFAEQLADELDADLRDNARAEVYANDLDDIEAQLAEEARRRLGTPGDVADDATPEDIFSNGIARISAHPLRLNEAFAATGTGLYRTLNGGSSWDLVFSGLGGESRFTSSVATLDFFTLVGTREGLYRSDDGVRWERFPGRPGSLPVVDVASALPTTVVALTNEGLFRSDDAGATWVRHVLPTELETAQLSAVDISPYNANDVVVGSELGVYLSRDGGRTFEQAGRIGLASVEINDVHFHPASSNVLIAATSRGVFITGDGRSWRELHEGMAATEIRRISIAAKAPYTILAATDTGGFLLEPGGRLAAKAEAIKQLKKQWDKEPSVAAVIGAALRYNHMTQDVLESRVTRARLQFLLPTIHGTFVYDRFRNESDTVVYDLPDYAVRRNRGLDLRPDGTRWEVVGMWDVSRILFAQNEVDAASLAQDIQRDRRRLLAFIVKAYAKRRSLMYRLALRGEGDSAQHIKDSLGVDQLTAQLDAVTDAFFSRYTQLRR